MYVYVYRPRVVDAALLGAGWVRAAGTAGGRLAAAMVPPVKYYICSIYIYIHTHSREKKYTIYI